MNPGDRSVLGRAFAVLGAFTAQRPVLGLAEVRHTGTVTCRQHLDPGSVAVAAPVRAGGSVVAAVSVVVATTEDPAGLLPALTAACRGISRGLAAG